MAARPCYDSRRPSALEKNAMHAPSAREARRWCEDMLPRVSRTFALNIRILDGEVRQAVLQAYLLCRIADTIEDAETGLLDKSTCLREYATLLDGIAGSPEGRRDAVRRWQDRHFAAVDSRAPEWQLCRQAETVFAAWESLPRRLQRPIEICVRDMSLGMVDVTARMRLDQHETLQIESLQDLESYCHIVAGTVGNMLCELFLEESDRLPHETACRMRSLAERFGLALQLVNILQDIQVDRRRRVSYLPRQVLASFGITSEDLFLPEHRSQRVAVLARLVTLAVQSCDAAIDFTLLLPRRQVRLRLFCLWPLFLALRTLHQVLAAVRKGGDEQRPRVPRRQVRRCLLRASIRVLSNARLRALYGAERRRVLESLQDLVREQGLTGALAPAPTLGGSTLVVRSRSRRLAGVAPTASDSRTGAVTHASGRGID
jgi:farnesyl-diphosphate farnesyltransferase